MDIFKSETQIESGSHLKLRAGLRDGYQVDIALAEPAEGEALSDEVEDEATIV